MSGRWFTLTVELEPGQDTTVALLELLGVKAKLDRVYLDQGKTVLTEGDREARQHNQGDTP